MRVPRSIVFAALLAAAVLACAQPARIPRVGVLANTVPVPELIAGTSANPAPRMLVVGSIEQPASFDCA